MPTVVGTTGPGRPRVGVMAGGINPGSDRLRRNGREWSLALPPMITGASA